MSLHEAFLTMSLVCSTCISNIGIHVGDFAYFQDDVQGLQCQNLVTAGIGYQQSAPPGSDADMKLSVLNSGSIK